MIHMDKKCLLSQLEEGEYGVVKKIAVTGNMRRRLQDLGLICGMKIKCLFKNVQGNVSAFNIREAVIALRDKDSSLIEVEKQGLGD